MTYRVTYLDGRIFGDYWGGDALGRATRIAARLGLVVTPISAFA